MMQKRIATYEDLLLEKFLREREQGLIVWRTRGNTEIAINRMSDSHLENLINYLDRQDEEGPDIGDLDSAMG